MKYGRKRRRARTSAYRGELRVVNVAEGSEEANTDTLDEAGILGCVHLLVRRRALAEVGRL
jgi:hypothetical protein